MLLNFLTLLFRCLICRFILNQDSWFLKSLLAIQATEERDSRGGGGPSIFFPPKVYSYPYIRTWLYDSPFVNYDKALGENNLEWECFENQKRFGLESALVQCFDGLLIVNIDDWQIVLQSHGVLTRLPLVPTRTSTGSDIYYWGVFGENPWLKHFPRLRKITWNPRRKIILVSTRSISGEHFLTQIVSLKL